MMTKFVAACIVIFTVGITTLNAKTITHTFYGNVSSIDKVEQLGFFTDAKVGDEIRFRYAFDDSAIVSTNPNNATFSKPFNFWSVSIGSQTVARFGPLLNASDNATFWNDCNNIAPDSITYSVFGDSIGSWGILLSLDDFDGDAMSRADLSAPIDYDKFDAIIGNIVLYDKSEALMPAGNNFYGIPSVAIDFSLKRFDTYQPSLAPTPFAASMGLVMLGVLATRRRRAI